MNLTLWILAGTMATAFLASGAVKLVSPKEKVVASGALFLADFSPSSIRWIGLLEMAGAVGLVLPAALDIAPVLVPLAAVGLGLMMTGAVIARLRHGQRDTLVAHIGVIAVFVLLAWGRFGPESFTQ